MISNCRVEGCTKRAKTRGLCDAHYYHSRTTLGGAYESGEIPWPIIKEIKKQADQCRVSFCIKPASAARSLCRRHYQSMWAAAHRSSVSIEELDESVWEPIRPIDRQFISDHLGRQWMVLDSKNASGYVSAQRTDEDGKIHQRAVHRIVMEEYMGRGLLRHETVHHKNGVRNDNRIDNLELWSSWQPAGQRIEDKIAWARDLLAFYASKKQ